MIDKAELRFRRETLDGHIRAHRHHIKAWEEQRADILNNTPNGNEGATDVSFLDAAVARAQDMIGGLIRQQLRIDMLLNNDGPQAA